MDTNYVLIEIIFLALLILMPIFALAIATIISNYTKNRFIYLLFKIMTFPFLFILLIPSFFIDGGEYINRLIKDIETQLS